MHKKLEAELIHLAHRVLKMNNTTDISSLRDTAQIIYENLSVLAFIDNYFVETPDVTGDKDDFLKQLQNLKAKQVVNKNNLVAEVDEKIAPKKEIDEVVAKEEPKATLKNEDSKDLEPEKESELIKEPISEKEKTQQLVDNTISTIKTEAKDIAATIQEKSKVIEPKVVSPLEEEMRDSIPADVAANMFERADKNIQAEKTNPLDSVNKSSSVPVKKEPIVEKPKVNIATKKEVFTPQPTPSSTSLNDRIHNQKIQVGLNDRIAFVKHLFNFSQEDFNRVLSQLNSFGSEEECLSFINTQVKPDYNWVGKEEYEERLLTLIERKFK